MFIFLIFKEFISSSIRRKKTILELNKRKKPHAIYGEYLNQNCIINQTPGMIGILADE